MESLAQVIEKAVEKQQADLNKKLKMILKSLVKLSEDTETLKMSLAEILVDSGDALVSLNGATPAKKPRAPISVDPTDRQLILTDLRMATLPCGLNDIVGLGITNRRKAAALRQLAAEGKVEQVKGGKWQAIVAEKVEGQEDGIR